MKSIKKIFAFLAIVIITIGITACSNNENEVKTENKIETGETEPQTTSVLTKKQLNKKLKKWDVYVKKSKYVLGDEKYKALYPDALNAIVKNNSNASIKSIVVAFVAWDEKGMPVKIKGYAGGDEKYLLLCGEENANIVPGGTFGEDCGWQVHMNTYNISSINAVVYSYTDFYGKEYFNPYYDEWCDKYENKLKYEIE